MINILPAVRAGVPLVVVETSDPTQTLNTITAQVKELDEPTAILKWDGCNGLQGVGKEGAGGLLTIIPSELDAKIATVRADECLNFLLNSPKNTIVFAANLHRLWEENVQGNNVIIQAIWNLRDYFASKACLLIMTVPLGVTVPAELKNDVITLTDTLPTKEEMDKGVDVILEAAKMGDTSKADRNRIRDTLLGLSSFGADQVLAMSITKAGKIDYDILQETKRRTIEQTRGLSVWRGSNRFADIGGYDNVKRFTSDLCKGDSAPKGILFIDEIEKAMQGAGGANDGGTSADQHACLLAWMENRRATGILFIGPPGTCKSEVAKCLGNEAGIPTIAFDLGAMKDKLVGNSEQSIRTALQVVDAVCQDNVLVIATCNSIGNLSPELRRRFCFGTFFFPLPNKVERLKIWEIWLKNSGLNSGPKSEWMKTLPDDTGWTGAEIRNCCLIAKRLKKTLPEAAKFIVPVSVSAAEQIDTLCRQSHRRYVSASTSGLFEYDKGGQQEPANQVAVKRAIARN